MKCLNKVLYHKLTFSAKEEVLALNLDMVTSFWSFCVPCLLFLIAIFCNNKQTSAKNEPNQEGGELYTVKNIIVIADWTQDSDLTVIQGYSYHITAITSLRHIP